jgi:hypothetical protein
MTPEEILTFIETLPNLSKFWTRGYMREQARQGFPQPWLSNLTEPDFEAESREELKKFEYHLSTIGTIQGFNKLSPGIRSNALDRFDSAEVEVHTLAWLSAFGCLREIQPALPTSTRECDFLIEIGGKQVYGEVWEPRILPDEWLTKGEDISIAFADQRSGERRRLRTLLRKGDSQLPNNVTGLWVSHIYHTALRSAWADCFRKDMATRANVVGAAIWTSRGSKSLASHGTRLKGLFRDEHEVYWVHNEVCTDSTLQPELLRMFKS